VLELKPVPVEAGRRGGGGVPEGGEFAAVSRAWGMRGEKGAGAGSEGGGGGGGGAVCVKRVSSAGVSSLELAPCVLEGEAGWGSSRLVCGGWELKKSTRAGLSPFVKNLAEGIFARHLCAGMPGNCRAAAM